MEMASADTVDVKVPEAVLNQDVIILGRPVSQLSYRGLDLGQTSTHDEGHGNRGMQQGCAWQLPETQILIVTNEPFTYRLWMHWFWIRDSRVGRDLS